MKFTESPHYRTPHNLSDTEFNILRKQIFSKEDCKDLQERFSFLDSIQKKMESKPKFLIYKKEKEEFENSALYKEFRKLSSPWDGRINAFPYQEFVKNNPEIITKISSLQAHRMNLEKSVNFSLHKQSLISAIFCDKRVDLREVWLTLPLANRGYCGACLKIFEEMMSK